MIVITPERMEELRTWATAQMEVEKRYHPNPQRTAAEMDKPLTDIQALRDSAPAEALASGEQKAQKAGATGTTNVSDDPERRLPPDLIRFYEKKGYISPAPPSPDEGMTAEEALDHLFFAIENGPSPCPACYKAYDILSATQAVPAVARPRVTK